MISIIILFVLRNTLNGMTVVFQTGVDFCNAYSPFLPETVKDLKIIFVLVTLLILKNSIGLGMISGFIFWGIIQLYEYGCELQNQADETL